MKLRVGKFNFEPSAIFFDKDGTLIDLLALHKPLLESRALQLASGNSVVRQALLQAWGIDPPTSLHTAPFVQLTRNQEILLTQSILTQLGCPILDVEMLGKIIADSDAAALRPSLIVALPGVLDFLSSLKEAQLKFGIVTGDTQRNAKATTIALDCECATIAGIDEVERDKPFPDLLELAAFRAECDLRRAIMVGDSVRDMEMATSCGVGLRIGVTSGASSRSALEQKADVVIDSFDELRIS